MNRSKIVSIENRTTSLLNNFNLSYDEQRILYDAIILCYKDQSLVKNVTKKLYPLLSEKHHISRIDKKIQSGIKEIWCSKNKKIFEPLNYVIDEEQQEEPFNSLFLGLVITQFILEDKVDAAPPNDKEVLLEICALFKKLHLPPHLNGFKYLFKSTFYYLKKNSPYYIFKGKDMYKDLTSLLGVTENQLENTTKFIIATSWKENKKAYKDLGYIFNRRPSLHTFLSLAVKKINNQNNLSY